MSNEAGVMYIGNNGSDGVCVGLTSTDKVGFYGATPVAQAVTIAAETASTSTTSFNAVLTALKNVGIIAAA